MVKHRPEISVVMSFYNGPLLWIEQAVSSILNQTYKDFEFIIICDKPDNNEAIEYIRLMEQKDERIKFIINSTNIGITKSLNIGLEMASGRFIARMDADDIAYPERLSRQMEFLEETPSRMLCSSDVDVIDAKGKIVKKRRNRHKYSPEWLFMENYISHPSVMFRRELLQLRSPFYNEFYKYTQDYELWIFLRSRGVQMHLINESLLQYRDSDQNISTIHRVLQNRYFQKLHRDLILSRLEELGIRCENFDLKDLLKKTSDMCIGSSGQQAKELHMILYVLYFTLAVNESKYILKYFMDPNRLFRHNRLQLSYQMLRAPLSGKRKKAYLDLKEAESL